MELEQLQCIIYVHEIIKNIYFLKSNNKQIIKILLKCSKWILVLKCSMLSPLKEIDTSFHSRKIYAFLKQVMTKKSKSFSNDLCTYIFNEGLQSHAACPRRIGKLIP